MLLSLLSTVAAATIAPLCLVPGEGGPIKPIAQGRSIVVMNDFHIGCAAPTHCTARNAPQGWSVKTIHQFKDSNKWPTGTVMCQICFPGGGCTDTDGHQPY